MKTTHKKIRSLLVVIAALGVLGIGSVLPAAATSRVVVTAGADVRVWVDDTYDVFPSYDDVAFSLRADRDCYVTVFVVDTDGFVHVVHPLSPRDNAWVCGGRTYRYSAFDLGLTMLYGRGVAHVFAIASPYPFDYSRYGGEIFAGGCGYRIYGDPYVACREIYISLLPASCRWDFIGVSSARFYIREWARYPQYLCRDHHGVHVRVGEYCQNCAWLYNGYRVHTADPYVVIHPRVRFRDDTARYAEVRRSTVKYKSSNAQTVADVRPRPATREANRSDIAVRNTRSVKSATQGRVVSTSSGREAVAGWTRQKTAAKAPTTTSVGPKSAPRAAARIAPTPRHAGARASSSATSNVGQSKNRNGTKSARTSAKKKR